MAIGIALENGQDGYFTMFLKQAEIVFQGIEVYLDPARKRLRIRLCSAKPALHRMYPPR